MKPYLLLLFVVLFSGAATAQNLTIEGHIRNLSGEPVVNAVLTLNTPSELQTVSDSSGFYQFNISEYPTAVYPFLNDDSKLQPGKIRLEFYEVSGRRIAAHEAELLPGGQISGLNTWQNPESGKLYIARVTDKNNRVFSRKFMYSTLQEVANGIFLKSAETGDTYHYEITIQPETENPAFAVVTLPVEGFSKTETSFTQDFMVNEFPVALTNGLSDSFSKDTLLVNADDKFKTDDNLNYSLVTAEGSELLAKIDGSNVKVYGTTKFDLVATDGAGNKASIAMDFEQYITLAGFTLDLVKDTSLNKSNTYITTEADFIQKRKQGNMSFTIFNKDNTFVSDITSDEGGNYNIELPAKGKYGIEIKTDGMYPMMYYVIADSIKNNENIASVNKSLSMWNFIQSHMGYRPVDGVMTPNSEYSRTLCWDPEVLEKGLKFPFLDKVVDDMTGVLGKPINQEMKDLFIDGRKSMNPYLNNIFDNENIVDFSTLENFNEEGNVTGYYFDNSPFGGAAGHQTKNGMVVRKTSGIHIGQYERYIEGRDERIKAGILQENSGIWGAFHELWEQEEGKQSIWYKSMPDDLHKFTEDSKKAQLFYNWIADKFISENTPAEGFHPSLISSRIAKEFNDNTTVVNYIKKHALPNIKEKYNITPSAN